MASRTNGPPFPRGGVWKFGRGQFPRGWPFGFLMPGSTLASSAYMPGPKERRALGYNRIPYWHVINYAAGAQVSLDDEILPVGNFILLALTATRSQMGPGFQSQFFQLADESGTGFRFSRIGIIDFNVFGTAERPWIFKIPYPLPNLLALLNRTANRSLLANTIQLAFYGVRHYQGGPL